MQKTKIEWVKNPDGSQGQSWNPIKGLCPVGCWYCYSKRIYDRFEWTQEGIGEIGYVAEYELDQPIKRKKPTGIFVCSTYELFHSPDKFTRDEIFKIIERCPQHRFYILTKFPQNIDRPIPHNVWLGVTITGDEDQWSKAFDLYRRNPKIRFISFEPLFQSIEIIEELWLFDWIIVGRLTGYGNKKQPERAWIKEIVFECEASQTPVFLKNNLKKIWGESLIQEFPK